MALPPESIEHYRVILTARREELAKEASRAESQVEDQAELTHLDPVDRATADNARDELLQAVQRDTGQLAQIEDALRRIQAGTYGTCAMCGKDIPTARLDAVPWAILCLEDQEIADQRKRALLAQGGAPSRVA